MPLAPDAAIYTEADLQEGIAKGVAKAVRERDAKEWNKKTEQTLALMSERLDAANHLKESLVTKAEFQRHNADVTALLHQAISDLSTQVVTVDELPLDDVMILRRVAKGKRTQEVLQARTQQWLETARGRLVVAASILTGLSAVATAVHSWTKP